MREKPLGGIIGRGEGSALGKRWNEQEMLLEFPAEDEPFRGAGNPR